ncbi:homeobox protein MOX-1-like [Coregonus clupeaformis]|uniref:homeobox protein MOX-1-like n=1 Tax=Coregonus clupeaformis TaxID=59861 RepID=UPI001E1C8813|nr:homeobox protein MOX-1-like [Coregonus clupeaformis]
MDQTTSSCMRSTHPGNPIWGCVRNPHPGAGLQSQAPFSLHQKPEYLAYTDFSTSCLVPAPYTAYPRDDRLYQEPHAGFQRADWQFPPCETRGRGQEACRVVPVAVVGGGVVGGVGGEMDSTGGEVPGAVPRCLKGEYSPQSMASADTEKKSSKRKRDIIGESMIRHEGISWGVLLVNTMTEKMWEKTWVTTSVSLHCVLIQVKCHAETEINK